MTTSKLALFADYYEFIMAYGYYKQGFCDKIAYFDVFFRTNPDGANFSVIAGLESIISYVKNFSFSDEDIEVLRKSDDFDEDFLDYLSKLRFSGDIYSLKEGSVAFPHEPILVVRAPIIQAQLMETYILAVLNHESLIATKAARIVRAAAPKAVIEYGARRAHGVQAATQGARAAIIAGCVASSNTLSTKLYGTIPSGTMAHSWVLMFENELDAFYSYTRLFKDNLVLLIDTYDPLSSGIENAILAFKEIDANAKLKRYGVRLDSGNLCELSIKIRKRLDEAGLNRCKIFVSGGLDEEAILKLEKKGAKIDAYGVGERLITSASSPVFGAVYKLCAMEDEKGLHPKMKLSLSKANLPHFKKLVRFYENSKALHDEILIHDEKTSGHELLEPIFKDGVLVYKIPKLSEIKAYCKKEVLSLNEEILSLNGTKKYEVKISDRLLKLSKKLGY